VRDEVLFKMLVMLVVEVDEFRESSAVEGNLLATVGVVICNVSWLGMGD
jgi:hypothetical protein